ncbi:MAG: ATP-binding protein [Acholeplasmataceae bacterium]|nr:ATP-binding protein [Acholeplasmataceae bacterium]
MMDKTRLFIISGPASVGKTTVARILAAHLSEKTAIVDGDDVAKFVCNDCDMQKMFLTNARSLINNFLKEGIDVIFSHALLPHEVEEITKDATTKDAEEVKVVFLVADLKTLQLRNRTRSVDEHSLTNLEADLDKFKDPKIDPRYIIDNSSLSLTQTAKIIIAEDRFIVK